MRRVRFWINSTFLIVPPIALTLGTVSLTRNIWNYLNSDARLAGLVSTEATQALGREVKVRNVKFRSNPWNLLPNRVELDDISIAQYPTLKSVLFAHTDKLVLWYDFAQVLFPRDNTVPYVKEVQVVGPRIALSRNLQGHWNFEQIFKPSGTGGRPFTNKFALLNAILDYADYSFPHPAGVPRTPLIQHLKQIGGIVLFRPDKGVSFTIGGRSDSGLMRNFQTTGIAHLSPLKIDARLIAHRIDLASVGSRVIPSSRVDVQSGTADIDVSLLYAPPANSAPNVIDPNAFSVQGALETQNLTLNTSQLDGPLQNVRLKGLFTTDSFSGTLSGRYAGMEAVLEGQILGLLKQEPRKGGEVKTVLASPTISLRGKVAQIDVARIIHVLNLDKRLQSIPSLNQAVRQQICGTTGQISNLKFAAAGAVDNPTISLSAHIDKASSFGAQAENTEVRALVNAKTVSADLRGLVEGGTLAAHASVQIQEPGTFAVEAHARNLRLKALRPFIKRDLDGRIELDLAMHGMRGATPTIYAQAQADDLSFSDTFGKKQTLRSLYARAVTRGHDLIVKQARIEDVKGLALLTGKMDLRTYQLSFNVAADNLDLHTVLAAVTPDTEKNAAKTLKPQPAASLPDAASNSAVLDAPKLVNQLSLLNPATIQGQGFLRGKIEGSLRNPEFSGRLSLFGVQTGEAELDRVIADFSLSKDALVISKGLVERYPGQITFSGKLEDLTSGNPTTRMQAQVSSLDIPDLLRLTGVQSNFVTGKKKEAKQSLPLDDYIILGTLSSGQALLEGKLKSLKLVQPATIHGENVSINGLPVTNVNATVAVGEGNIHLQTARADAAGGTIVVAGTLNDIAHQLQAKPDLNVQVDNLDLTKLETAFPPNLLPLNLSGFVNLTARMRGTLQTPIVTASANAHDILLTDDKGGSYEVGNIQAQAEYEAHHVVIANASIREKGLPNTAVGEIHLEQVDYDTKQGTIRGLAKWDRLRLVRLRTLFNQSPFAQSGVGLQIADTLRALTGPLAGSITGQAKISGELKDPSIDMMWNTSPIQIEDHTISSFTGSAVVSKHELHIPSQTTPEQIVRLQSDDIDIEVPTVNAFFKKGGALAADIRANKLNLEFLHHFSPAIPVGNPAGNSVGKRASKEDVDSGEGSDAALLALRNISGGGTAEIVASGTTDAPVVEASINLKKVVYKDPVSHDENMIDRIDVTHLTAKEGQIDIDSVEILKTGMDQENKKEMRFEANARGNIDFSWKWPFIQKDAAFDVRANVPEQELTVLSLFKQDLNVTSDGRFALTAHLFDKINKYQVGGSLRFEANKLQFGTAKTGLYHTGLRDIRGELDFLNDRVQVKEGFTARTQVFGKIGKNGTLDDPNLAGSPIQLSGSLPLRGNGSGEGIRLRADRIAVDETPLGVKTGSVRGEVGAALTFKGSLESTTIGGLLTVSNTTVSPPSDFGTGGGGSIALPINPKFDLLLRLDKNVHIENQQLTARIDGTITVTGPLFVDDTSIPAQPTPRSVNQNAGDPSPLPAPRVKKSSRKSGGSSLSPTENAPAKRIGLNVVGRLAIQEGKLKLPTAAFLIVPPAGITISYPSLESSQAGIPALGIDVDLHARSRLWATSISGIHKSYVITVAAHGPITGPLVDPVTGNSLLTLEFTTDPNDLAVSQQALQQRLAGVLGGDAIGQFGRNPGQVLAQQLSNVFTTSIVTNLSDKLGLETLQIGYDPIDGPNLIVSRQIFGTPFYVTYNRTLGAVPEVYDLKFSWRFKDRYQLSYEQDQNDQQRILLEGIWKF